MLLLRILSISILCLLLVSCGQQNPNPIIISEVDSLVMYYHFPDDTVAPSPRKLSSISSKKFIDIWNSTHNSEPRKYYPNYLLTVYFKNKTQREFRATGQIIKEQSDESYDFVEKDFFDKLWEGNK